jgi:hypothetical protein
MRVLILVAALVSSLGLAVPAGSQSEMPTDLWSEYPLVQKVEGVKRAGTERAKTDTRAVPGPFLPPPEAPPSSGESTRWSIWLAVLGLGAVALLFAARAAPGVAASGARVVGEGARRLRAETLLRSRQRAEKPEPMQLKEDPLPRAPVARSQYAPPTLVVAAETDTKPEPRRYVVRRTGFFRSHFDVLTEDQEGVKTLARSKSYWSVGSAARQERADEGVWSALMRDLEAAGWEPDYGGTHLPGSEYYVLLRRMDERMLSILPTIDAYALVPDESDRD